MVIGAFVGGWLLAQILKTVMYYIWQKKSSKDEKSSKDKKSFWEVMTKSGGMPSGHAASMVAGSVMTGWVSGFDSVEFAIFVCVTAIVLYDAVNVRWAVGELGKKFNSHDKLNGLKEMRVVEGHVLPEVIVGSLLGVIVALILIVLGGK